MLNAPGVIDREQLTELQLRLNPVAAAKDAPTQE
jgi:hypothetical protein